MKVVGWSRLEQSWKADAEVRTWLRNWRAVAEAAEWRHLPDVKETFQHADGVPVRRKVATVFNRGRTHRLIVTIDYELQIVMGRWLLTHAEYDRGRWKEQL